MPVYNPPSQSVTSAAVFSQAVSHCLAALVLRLPSVHRVWCFVRRMPRTRRKRTRSWRRPRTCSQRKRNSSVRTRLGTRRIARCRSSAAAADRHLMDVRVCRIYEGTDEILKLKIALALLGEEYEAFK